MSDNAKLDEELAAFTDNMLAGREIPVSEEMEPLTQVVRQLHSVIAPDTPASPAFRTHLTQRLIREWNQLHQHPSRHRRFRQWQPVIALAASLIVVMLVVVLLSDLEDNSNEPLQGTALGSGAWGVFIIVGLLITTGLLIYWLKQRKNR
jgi:hypothetical protein